MGTSEPMERDGTDPVRREAREMLVEGHLDDLDTQGYTVIPPDKVGTPDLFDRMRDAVLRLVSERTGFEHTLDGEVRAGKLRAQNRAPNQLRLYYLLTEDSSFRNAASHPVVKPVLQHVLGASFNLSSCTALVKSKGDSYGPTLGLHADAEVFPEPLPESYGHVCNTNWVLTDYTADDGALCVVPGSHRRCRHPRPGDGLDEVVPVEARAGSVIVLHPNVWHGAVPKETDGLRLSVNCYYGRPYVRLQENYRGVFANDVMLEMGEWFAQLIGEFDTTGWRNSVGPVYQRWSLLLRRRKEGRIESAT